MTRPPRMELRRHYHQMSEKDADSVVQTVADLIVGYLKRNPQAMDRAASAEASAVPSAPATTTLPVKEIQE